MGVKDDIPWSKIESGFGEADEILPPRIPRSTPPPPLGILEDGNARKKSSLKRYIQFPFNFWSYVNKLGQEFC